MTASDDYRLGNGMRAAELELAPVEEQVLMLLGAHEQATNSPTVRRTTLEAYARLGASQASSWAVEASAGGLRRALGEALRSLRSRSLVALGDDGFRLTEAGEDLLRTLEREGVIDERLREALSSIKDLRSRWQAEVR